MFEDAAAFLRSVSQESVSVPVAYICRDGTVFNFTAVLGRTVFRAEKAYGTIVREVSHDFLVSAEDCTIDPKSGDRIICGSKAYEVLAPNGESVWRYSDNFGKIRRIHTKEVGNV